MSRPSAEIALIRLRIDIRSRMTLRGSSRHLRQVAAGPVLNADADRKVAHILKSRPFRERGESVHQIVAVADLVDNDAELGRDRVVHVFCNRGDRCVQRMPDRQTARHQIQRIGQLLATGVQTAASFQPDRHDREEEIVRRGQSQRPRARQMTTRHIARPSTIDARPD